MSSMVQKNEIEQDEKMDMQNSQNLMLQNNDSNKYSTNNYKNTSSYRKTSKRRQAQEQKAVVMELFKDLIKVVNQKFQNAYLSPPKTKLPKLPKIVKNSSVKPTKKEENLKKKEQNISTIINNQRVEDKSQSRQLSHPAFTSIPNAVPHQTVINSHSSPQPFQTFNSGSHINSHMRKSSQHASHRQKSLNQKHNVLKEALKKEIYQNYSVQMKYVVHEDFEQEIEELKQLDNASKMIDESSEHQGIQKTHKNSRNFLPGEPLDDLELLSHEEEMQHNFIKSIKNITNPLEQQDNLMIEELQKFEEDVLSSSSSSSCEQNQKYPPHSHMPEGHASTTEQFLQQHHPIVTNLTHSSQVIKTENKTDSQQQREDGVCEHKILPQTDQKEQ